MEMASEIIAMRLRFVKLITDSFALNQKWWSSWKNILCIHNTNSKLTDLKIQRPVSMDKWIKQFVPVRFHLKLKSTF